MTIEACSSCGQSPVEYARKLSQIDNDNNTILKDSSSNAAVAAQQPVLDINRALDIFV